MSVNGNGSCWYDNLGKCQITAYLTHGNRGWFDGFHKQMEHFICEQYFYQHNRETSQVRII